MLNYDLKKIDNQRVIDFIGIRLNNLTSEQILDHVDYCIKRKSPCHIVGINVDQAIRVIEDKYSQQIFNNAEIVFVDGKPMVWMCKWLNRPVVEKVIEDLELDMDYEQFVGTVVVNNPVNTRFINITVSNHDPYMAKTIVDKLTDVSAERMGTIMETEEPNVADYGNVPEHPTSPSLTKNALIGAVLGFVLSVGIILVLYLMNDAIHTTEDVERYLGINTLGLIPLQEGTSKKATRGHDKDMMKAKKARKKENKQKKKQAKKKA